MNLSMGIKKLIKIEKAGFEKVDKELPNYGEDADENRDISFYMQFS